MSNPTFMDFTPNWTWFPTKFLTRQVLFKLILVSLINWLILFWFEEVKREIKICITTKIIFYDPKKLCNEIKMTFGPSDFSLFFVKTITDGFDISGLSYLRSYVEKKIVELHSHPENKNLRKKEAKRNKTHNYIILYRMIPQRNCEHIQHISPYYHDSRHYML